MTQSGSTVDELDDAPASLGERLRAAALVPVRLLGALFLPDRFIPRQVGKARYGWPLVVLVVCGLLGAAVVSLRLDPTTDVLKAAAGGGRGGPGGPGGGGPGGGGPGGPGGGQAGANVPTKTDREIAESIAKKLSVERVMRSLDAGLWFPFKFVVLLGIFFYILLRYVGGTPTFERTLAATAHASLPFAVKALVIGGAAFTQASLTPSQADALVGNPLQPAYAAIGPVASRMLSGVDPFVWWSVLLLGFGLAAAGEITRKRAFVALAWIFILYLALTRIACGAGGEMPPDMPPRGR